MKVILKLVILLMFSNSIFSQKTTPIIKATSKTVDIKIGDKLNKGEWTISPDLLLDIYDVGAVGEVVTFYTDIDSISAMVRH